MKLIYNRTDLLAAAKFLSKKNKGFARDVDWTVNWLEKLIEQEVKANFKRKPKDFISYIGTGGVLLTFAVENESTMGVGIYVTPTFKRINFIEIEIK